MFVQNTYCWLVTKSLKNTRKRNQIFRKLQGSSVFMFSKCELFSQVFLKDKGLMCRKFIKQNRTFAAQLLVAAFDVLDLSVLFAYWDGYTFSQRSFLKMFTSQTTVACCFFCLLMFGLIILIIWRSHDTHATLLWMFLWQNYFLASIIDYMQPHISRYGHTLEINTFILVNLISYEKICKLCIHT